MNPLAAGDEYLYPSTQMIDIDLVEDHNHASVEGDLNLVIRHIPA